MKKVFSLLLLAAGAVLALYGYSQISDAMASSSWPSVKGEILHSEVEEKRRAKPPKDQGKRTKYSAKVAYEYIIDGTKYHTERVSYGETPSNSRTPAETVVARYPAGKAVDVFYKPSKPKVAVLEPGMTVQAWLFPAVGVILFLIGLFSLFRK